jgi:hypothetical protein
MLAGSFFGCELPIPAGKSGHVLAFGQGAQHSDFWKAFLSGLWWQPYRRWGEEVSSNRIKGVEGFLPGIDTIMYVWKNPDGSNMNAVFQNEKMVSKAQIGLR